METGREIDKGARSSMERYRELISGNNKYIELNPASISNDHTDLHSNYITNTLNTDHTLSTVQRTSRRERDTRSAIKGNMHTEKIASTNRIPPNH